MKTDVIMAFMYYFEFYIFNQFGIQGLVLWCLTPLSTIFQLNRGDQFYWCKKPEYTEKITDLSVSSILTFVYRVYAS